MLMGLAAGFAIYVPVNVRLVGLKPIVALAVVAVIVNVTGRVLAGTPEADTVTVAL
jgi:hypothetical protein